MCKMNILYPRDTLQSVTFYLLPLHNIRSHGIKVRDALKAKQVAGKYY